MTCYGTLAIVSSLFHNSYIVIRAGRKFCPQRCTMASLQWRFLLRFTSWPSFLVQYTVNVICIATQYWTVFHFHIGYPVCTTKLK